MNIQIGVPQLGETIAQNTLAHLYAGGGVIAVRTGVIKAFLVQPLPGISQSVHVGNVIARYRQAGLSSINRQTCLRKRAKCTNAHKSNLHAPHGAKIEIKLLKERTLLRSPDRGERRRFRIILFIEVRAANQARKSVFILGGVSGGGGGT